MVLEHLFPEDWLEHKLRYAFIIAAVYSTVGIIISSFLFGANSGIVSVIFTSLFILPYLQKMFKDEENEEEREGKYDLFKKKSFFKFFRKNQAIRVYLAIFLGVYLVFLLYSFLLPQLGFDTTSIFREQMVGEMPVRGNADLSGADINDILFNSVDSANIPISGQFGWNTTLFFRLIFNNWWILFACFVLSIMTGDGGIFFITWNASAWGTAMGYRALTAGIVTGESAWFYLLMLILITLPHLLLEGGAYLLAAISGGIISNEIVKSRDMIKQFIAYLIIGLLIIFSVNYLTVSIIGFTKIWSGVINILLFVGLIYLIKNLFIKKNLRKVFLNNYTLFIIAIIFFLLGAIVETIVLRNSVMLNNIYFFSHLYGLAV